MKKRTRHRVDLLPLLDVFMVVLFVFATIQEERLDATTALAAGLEAQLEQARAERAPASADELVQMQAELAQVHAELAAAREQVNAQAGAMAEVQANLADVQSKAQTLVERAGGVEQVRRQDVLSKLLDHFSVFEIELSGIETSDGVIVNRCCFRSEPLGEAWTACGEVPIDADERRVWFDDGSNPLLAALRRTKGGNALVVVRQDVHASYRVADRVEALARERFPDYKVYEDGVATHALAACP